MSTSGLMIQSIGNWFLRYRRYFFGAGTVILVAWSFHVVQFLQARPATLWMNMYWFSDIKGWGGLLEFLKELRTGIPPALATIEIISDILIQSVKWWIRDGYHVLIVMMFALPLYLVRGKWLDALIAWGLGLVFVAAMARISPGNPELYDAALGAFIMCYLVISQLSFRKTIRPWIGKLLAVSAGFFLAMIELARPFMLVLLPMLVAWNVYHYWPARHRVVYFLVPVLLLSGGWHLKLLTLNKGQVLWSNHSGSNLSGAWHPIVDWEHLDTVLLPEEPPIHKPLWKNLNTDTHTYNSQLRKQAVWDAMQKKPQQSWDHLVRQFFIFTGVRTNIYKHDPQGPLITIYRWSGRILFGLLGLLLAAALVRILRNPKKIFETESVILIFAAYISFIPIIGDTNEEARFLFPVLPLLMVISSYGIARGEAILKQIKSRPPEDAPPASTH